MVVEVQPALMEDKTSTTLETETAVTVAVGATKAIDLVLTTATEETFAATEAELVATAELDAESAAAAAKVNV